VNELAAIRLAAKGPFWTALVFWHDSESSASKRDGLPLAANENGTFRKVSSFLERYSRWRRLARQSSLSRCLETALAETQYDTFLMTQPRGEERNANIQRLLRLAQQFDSFQRQGLFRFLRFVDAQRRANTEPEVKPTVTEDSVRLMSIHQSKGLEFPVVVVADLNKPFNLVDLRGNIILDEQYGLCPQIKPPHTGKRYPSLPYWLARRRQQRELLGEELRLLYVAMTRAKDTLLLSASISQRRLDDIGSGNFKLRMLKDARSTFDWIGHWFANHQTEEAPAIRLASDIVFGTTPVTATLPTSGKTRLLSWSIHTDTKLLEPGAELPGDTIRPVVEDDRKAWARLQERLSWQYPFGAATQTQAKASVTALRRRATTPLDDEVFGFEIRNNTFQELQAEAQNELPLRGAKESAAKVGSANHRFLQLVALDQTGSIAELTREARRLKAQNLLTAEELELLDFEALAAFWTSQLGSQLREHQRDLRRELQFTARFSTQALAEVMGQSNELFLSPKTSLIPDSLSQEFIVVQGVADLVVLKPDQIWVVDFKTDSIHSDLLNARAKLYEPQMKLYSRAFALIYNRPVTACWIYFLTRRTAVEIQLT
jgi:ATP-dependent helicase/nuclease subunit A